MKRFLLLTGLSLFIFFFINFEPLFTISVLQEILKCLGLFIAGLIFIQVIDQIFDLLWSVNLQDKIPLLKYLKIFPEFKPPPPNYSTEQTQEIVHKFKSGETLEAIAADAGKTTNSIRGKLVSEGIYSQYKDINLRVSQMAQEQPEPLLLSTGLEYSRESLIQYLNDAGYMRVSTVDKEGYYSVLGGIIYIFPFGENEPILFDYFGDTIETIKRKDKKITLPSIVIYPYCIT
jgi:hypothetical protein